MNYFSTNKQSASVNFREATIQGQAGDKGLYFPENIPTLDNKWLRELKSIADHDIALNVIQPYVRDTIPVAKLRTIVEETLSFPIPLVQVDEQSFALELFHGPTLAFKDVGARFMSRCLGYFLRNEDRKVTVLVATSGDTGGAVASGFEGVAGVDVVILYPSGKVSAVQEQQLTTAGGNIHALEVNGSFDDCQDLVKQAFADEMLRSKLFLTSANSINVARWLPQQFYYFLALKQWSGEEPPVISVPSGNFGNICAGLLASVSGLPVKHFIAACNANQVIPDYLHSGNYEPKAAIPTISNAMDVGNPSNFVRILELFHHQFPLLKEKLSSVSISDPETIAEIARVYKENEYVLDPHGAVASLALQRFLAGEGNLKGIFLETAHPVKFPGPVEAVTGSPIALPPQLSGIMERQKVATRLEPNYADLQEFLLAKGGK